MILLNVISQLTNRQYLFKCPSGGDDILDIIFLISILMCEYRAALLMDSSWELHYFTMKR